MDSGAKPGHDSCGLQAKVALMLDTFQVEAAATVALSDIAVLNPRLEKKLAPDTPVSFVPMAGLSAEFAGIVGEETRYYRNVAKGYTPFQDGDLLVAKITPCFENNKIGHAKLSRRDGFGSTEFHVIRPHAAKADARYLLHFLRQDYVRAEGERKMTGSAGQRRVPEHFLAGLTIPLPSLAEQRRIATILDHADALRAKRRAALARLDEMARAIFVKMFDAIPAEQRTKLGDRVTEFRYGTSTKSAPDGYPALRIPNVIAGEINVSDLKNVPVEQREFKRLCLCPGDLLFVRTNGNPDYVGRCAVVPDDLGQECGLSPDQFIFASYLIRARVNSDELDSTFVQFFLTMPDGRQQVREFAKTSAGQFNINTESLAALEIPVAPVHQQRAFSAKIRALRSIAGIQRRHLTDLDSLFASLQHRAFRGEL